MDAYNWNISSESVSFHYILVFDFFEKLFTLTRFSTPYAYASGRPTPAMMLHGGNIIQRQISRWVTGREKARHAATKHASWLTSLSHELKEYGEKYHEEKNPIKSFADIGENGSDDPGALVDDQTSTGQNALDDLVSEVK
jgi:hypothetical protein